MMPSVPECVSIQFWCVPVSLKDQRTLDKDLTGFSGGQDPVKVIGDSDVHQRRDRSGGSRALKYGEK